MEGWVEKGGRLQTHNFNRVQLKKSKQITFENPCLLNVQMHNRAQSPHPGLDGIWKFEANSGEKNTHLVLPRIHQMGKLALRACSLR
jgi:hypothetical protein